MNDYDLLKDIYNSLLKGELDMVYQYQQEMNKKIMVLLNMDLTEQNFLELELLIKIGNITYNNLSSERLPIEDGIYDLMIEKYRKYTTNDTYPVGAPHIEFPKGKNNIIEDIKRPLMTRITNEEKQFKIKMVFPELVNYDTPRLIGLQPARLLGSVEKVKRKTHNTVHEHPDLVGTFDKCKYVLTSQAQERGVHGDPNVSILERDFFGPLLRRGVIGYNEEIIIIAELKYDGVSVEADVSDKVLSARTRGDTGVGKAADITSLLEGYDFGNNIEEVMGMKFEAVITYPNLQRINELSTDSKYVNCRTAINGLTGNGMGRKFRDFISLVPLATDKMINGQPIDRLVELEFLNKYYAKDVPMKYSVLKGNYANILFQMKRYVEEAEYARKFLPFMYDGVVFEFYDLNIRKMLGRDHSIDRYKVAIKFNPLKKQTVFRFYTFTVGQDGTITPMIHYDAVEFMGTIHTKSTGHSYERFKNLNLHVGDIIDVEYTNDVMPYVNKPTNAHNTNNSFNQYTSDDSFPTTCPCCESPLVISASGRSINCINLNCLERSIKRMESTFDKLGIEDFKESSIRLINMTHLYQYLSVKDVEEFKLLGEGNKYKLKTQLDNLKKTPIYDYKIIGSLGFNNTAIKTWKLIFNKMSIKEILHMVNGYNGDMSNLRAELISIKGIGQGTINTIINEFHYFINDINYICNNMNVISTKAMSRKKQIRFTGCRDKQLVEQLSNLGYDIDGESGITKETNILLIPYAGFTQGSKFEKATRYGITIIPINEFKESMYQYL